MKKIFIAIGFIVLTGCVSLTENPTGILSPKTLFTSEAGFDAAITGIYYQLYNGYNGYDYAYPLMAGAGAEDIASYSSAKVFQGLDQLQPTPNTPTLGYIWRISYLAIAGANGVIQNGLSASGLPSTTIASYSAEAKFLRAFCYFNLTRWFGRVPLITEANQLTADRVDESAETDIYSLIVSDLQYAESNLTKSTTLKSRPNYITAKALLAKVYLTMAGYPLKDNSKYSLAASEALEVINLGQYSLTPNFADLWVASNALTSPELIFCFFGSYNNAAVGSHLHLASRPAEGGESGWGDFYTESRFLNQFPAGPRKDASFHTTFYDGTTWDQTSRDAPFISKYRDGGLACGTSDPSCSLNGGGFFNLLRYADVLLLFAEASNASNGPTADAYDALNQVRRRAAGVDPKTPNSSIDLSGLSQADFDAAVLAERNWELAFEGNRWFDLVRKEMVVSVNSALYPHVDAHNLLLPKPASELALSSGKISQNPGY